MLQQNPIQYGKYIARVLLESDVVPNPPTRQLASKGFCAVITTEKTTTSMARWHLCTTVKHRHSQQISGNLPEMISLKRRQWRNKVKKYAGSLTVWVTLSTRRLKVTIEKSFNQCCGSGSTCFWASRIRIHQSELWIRIRFRIFHSSCKNCKKNLDSYYFVTDSFWLFIFEKWCKCTFKK